MNELFNRVNWDKIRGFLYGVGIAVVYWTLSTIFFRLSNLEQMVYTLYQALSGQRN